MKPLYQLIAGSSPTSKQAEMQRIAIQFIVRIGARAKVLCQFMAAIGVEVKYDGAIGMVADQAIQQIDLCPDGPARFGLYGHKADYLAMTVQEEVNG